MRKHNRLLDAAAFGRVFRRASRSRDKWFTVLYRPNGQGAARLGLAIAKKHCRAATARNRIKRLVRESFRLRQGSLMGLDIVVMNQRPAELASNQILVASLESHWKRLEAATTGEQE